MLTRRQVLGGLAAGATTSLATAQTAPHPPTPWTHWVAGGVGGLVSARYGLTAQGQVDGLGTINLPAVDTVCVLPLTTVLFDESSGADFVLENQMIRILQRGKYRITVSVDWPAQHGVDTGLREYGVQRLKATDALAMASLPALTMIKPDKFDRLAWYDVPASEVPTVARSAKGLMWNPGTLAAGASVALDVPVTPAGVVQAGDAAQVGLSSLTSALLGPAADLMTLQARVEAADRVRVVLRNASTAAVRVPAGKLNVLAGSLTQSTGNSADAWLTVQTPDELLYEGERVFGMFKSQTAGDFIQVSNMSFLQIERVA
jgi:hypothetical protein